MKTYFYFIFTLIIFTWGCENDYIKDLNNNEIKKNTPLERIWLIKSSKAPTKATSLKDKLWTPGNVIRIKFLNGSSALQEDVKKYATQWLNHAYLTFQFVSPDSPADVKIGFDLDSKYIAWSTIGTDCKEIPQNEPSLNFVWLEDEDENGKKAEILKGFGHVLGLVFEHQNPNSSAKIKSSADIAGEFNLSTEIAEKIKQQYTTTQCNSTQYDKHSIMALEIPRSMLTNPREYTSRNEDLSPTDIALIKQLYPYSEATITMTTIKDSVLLNIFGFIQSECWIDWGDGNRINNPNSQEKHIYTDETKSHTITLGGHKIMGLECVGCGITEIDITKIDTTLKILICPSNELLSLNLSQNTKLVDLVCSNNKIRNLSISHLSELKRLECNHNELDSLNVKHNTKLETLSCGFNKISSLILDNHPLLTHLSCQNNLIPSLTLNLLPNLIKLECEKNKIKKLSLTHNTLIKEIFCDFNELISIEINNCKSLHRLSCSANQLPNINLSDNINLNYLNIDFNELISLPVLNNVNLTSISCMENKITTLNLSNNPHLEELWCINNPTLSSLNIKNNHKLKMVHCDGCNLSSIELPQSPLISVGISCNPLNSDLNKLEDIANSLPYAEEINPGKFYIDPEFEEKIRLICTPKNWIVNPIDNHYETHKFYMDSYLFASRNKLPQ